MEVAAKAVDKAKVAMEAEAETEKVAEMEAAANSAAVTKTARAAANSAAKIGKAKGHNNQPSIFSFSPYYFLIITYFSKTFWLLQGIGS
ncbi:MAG: hypothetical protein HOC79_06580 [Euryarchaeota archaeon]|nr:hypothetical protein [Euryarchaeota archaeon]MBT4407522.1 hypothetical protein [Euryarchaeota archaeon]